MRRFVNGLLVLLLAMPAGVVRSQTDAPPIELFFEAASVDTEVAAAAQAALADAWRDDYAAPIVDLIDLLSRAGFVDPRSFVQMARLAQFLEGRTGQAHGPAVAAWRQWVWSLPYEPHPAYGEFKGLLYANLDSRFAEFFVPPVDSSIRLDEIQWGGVGVNGIPPLEGPAVVDGDAAAYLDDGDIVFGIRVDGMARAYPKRILAWHELALDTLGGQDLTIVYCTLCGTVIPFESEVGGEVRRFGTSGLLYRSNKLMFDAETMSLWSSLTGRPVVGPLVGSGLALTALPVVTTTWGEWRRRHPDTTVLSIATGHVRDYSEGAAYAAYFGTDELMFDVMQRDGRLPNKAEVLVLRNAPAADGESPQPVAIAASFLREHPVYHLTVGGRDLVVITDSSGANRAYAAGPNRFVRPAGDDRVIDEAGRQWLVSEGSLRPDFEPGPELPRVAAHRAFWFGWYAQYPTTVLID